MALSRFPSASKPVRHLRFGPGIAARDRVLPVGKVALEILGHAPVTESGCDERGLCIRELRVAGGERTLQGFPPVVHRVACVLEGRPLHDDDRDRATDDQHDQESKDPRKTPTHRPATIPAQDGVIGSWGSTTPRPVRD